MASGDTLIPNGVIDTFKLDDKATVVHNIVRSTDSDTNPSAPTWASSTPTSSLITNSLTLTDEPTGNIVLVMYTSVNDAYMQSAPKPVISVDNKVIASNSHSKYKGALVGNQVAGKIQVGNGANGYESKVLENVQKVGYNFYTTNGGNMPPSYSNGFVVWYRDGGAASGTVGHCYERIGGDVTGEFPLANQSFAITSSWRDLGALMTPQHSSIALDSSVSSASKYFYTSAEDSDNTYAQVFGERITYDGVGLDWGDTDFTQLTNGTIPDVNGGSDVRTFCGLIPLNIGVK